MADEKNTDNEEKTAKALPKKWKCPECKQVTTLYISPTQAPECQNPFDHKGKIFTMDPA